MALKNSVTAGDYADRLVNISGKKMYIKDGMFGKKIYLSKETIESYEVVSEENYGMAGSAVARGAVGAALLGPVGIAAAASAKKKGLTMIAVQFKDGKRSLLELDQDYIKQFTRVMF